MAGGGEVVILCGVLGGGFIIKVTFWGSLVV